MEAHGVRLLLAAAVVRAEARDGERVVHVQVAGRAEEIAGDELLVATGRAPNVEDLGLEAAGVAYSHRGVGVNDRLRTSNPRIFAVGDICSKYQFTHVADATARLVVANALFFGLGGGKVSSLVMPWVTYTTPEVAHVGMTEADATAADIRVQTITVPLARGGPGGARRAGGGLPPGASQGGHRPHPRRHARGRARRRHDRRDRAGDHGRRRAREDRVHDSSLSHSGRGVPEGGGRLAADEAHADREAGVQARSSG